jgi:ATP-dependent DNA ligase
MTHDEFKELISALAPEAAAQGTRMVVDFPNGDRKLLEHLQRLAEPIKTRRQLIASGRAFPKAQWLEPILLADVEYRGKTKRGNLLRHPSYKGLRDDLMR